MLQPSVYVDDDLTISIKQTVWEVVVAMLSTVRDANFCTAQATPRVAGVKAR
jgi:hypothetical protein